MSQVGDRPAPAEVQEFISAFVERIAPIEKALELAWWNLNTTGEKRYEEDMVAANVALADAFLEPGEYQRVEEWYGRRDELEDPLLARQIDVLRRMFVEKQQPPEHVRRISQLEAELESAYNNHRGHVDGQEVSDNEIVEALKNETDLAQRKQFWEASKDIGAEVEERLLELVGLRNEVARLQGFRDYYARSLYLQDIDEDELLSILDELETRSRGPFEELKAGLDRTLAARFGVAAEDLRSWHYADPFFQQAPPSDETNTDALFAGADVEALTRSTFAGIGLEIDDVMARSDLYERPGKTQHAFCACIGRNPDDVRVLCNLRPDSRWMGTNLHEFGHAIYDKYLDRDLPWLLRTFAHLATTEAIAMLMGRLALDATWLARVLGKDPAEVAGTEQAVHAQQRLEMLIFMRWGLVMVHFERALYRGVEGRDLNKLWWDLVHQFQLVPRPEGRDRPDWASKIHIATTPVYYHNYILGELTASQLQHYLQQEGGIVLNRKAGTYLRDRLFQLGARYPWNETLKLVTGERLNPRYFVEQFVEERTR